MSQQSDLTDLDKYASMLKEKIAALQKEVESKSHPTMIYSSTPMIDFYVANYKQAMKDANDKATKDSKAKADASLNF